MHPLPVCLLPGFNQVIFGHSFDTGGLLIGFSGFAHLYSTFTTLYNFFLYLLSFNKHK